MENPSRETLPCTWRDVCMRFIELISKSILLCIFAGLNRYGLILKIRKALISSATARKKKQRNSTPPLRTMLLNSVCVLLVPHSKLQLCYGEVLHHEKILKID